MDTNITQTVYNTLESSLTPIAEAVAEYNLVESGIKSGRYSPKALKEEIYPERDALKRKINNLCDGTIEQARASIEQYRKDVEASNRLDPTALTDDIKLLQPGIILQPGDIKGMLERNENNKTMLQIILRYAKEHDIDVDGIAYVGGEAENQLANNLEFILKTYRKYMATPNAGIMLQKFFSGDE